MEILSAVFSCRDRKIIAPHFVDECRRCLVDYFNFLSIWHRWRFSFIFSIAECAPTVNHIHKRGR